MNKFSNARKIFHSAIQAVQPDQMIEANLVRNHDTLYFGTNPYNFSHALIL